MISLAGIVVNNAIVLCDFIIQDMKAGSSRRDAILNAGQTRLRPVMLTALTTVLGLVPLTAGINFDFLTFELLLGGESTDWWGPMGVSVIFGLTFATVLTLVVVPVTFDVLSQFSDFLTGKNRRRAA
ncbi:MAG: efflux RND transporter permease subunit [Acidobacteria bacterium]|nr:efflux RND transporter permease subunit [Acidobacteriota bacterium]